MKIKLAILEKDKNYLSRVVSAFNARYVDKLEIYSFTELDIALKSLETDKIDVFIAGDEFDVDFDKIPKQCGFAYFVDSPDVGSFNNRKVICKFQKADLIYKAVLDLYAENTGNTTDINDGKEYAKIVAFSSMCGGVGTSSLAAAYAIRLSGQGKRTLYLNLEKYGSSDVFFKGEGQFNMSDVIFSLKSKKSNLPLKLESYVKRDPSGVYFYSQSKVALDMLELGKDETIQLLSELRTMGAYDYIVVDTDFSLSDDALDVLNMMNHIVVVGDGSETSNSKISRAVNSLTILEQNKKVVLSSKLILIYNKFSNKTGKTVDEIDINNIGGAPRYEHATSEQIVKQLSAMSMFDRIG